MDDQRVIDIILKTLDTLNEGLNKLSKFSNSEITSLKIKVAELSKDIETLQKRTCPVTPESVVTIVDVERLKSDDIRREKTKKLAIWIIAVIGGTTGLIVTIDRIINIITGT